MDVFERHLGQELTALEQEGRLRESTSRLRDLAQAAAQELRVPLVDAASNDYLSLGLSDVSRETNVQLRAPIGAGASRLIHGTHAAHLELEHELAAWVALDSALLWTSGYGANVGLYQALGHEDAVFVSDALNHASIIDGCRLSRARVEVVPHLSLPATEACLAAHAGARLRCVITESYFSMDGDSPDLGALRVLCDRHSAALIVDEAHALGVFGPAGGGRCRESAVIPDALVGTLGKAVGIQGAFVAGSRALRELLWNRARSFVYSTAPSPALAEVTRFHVERCRADDAGREVLHQRAQALREALKRHSVTTVDASFGPIVPVLVGDDRFALEVVERLARAAILAQAIRPPTVPPGTARVRLTVKATWSESTPERVAGALERALSK